MLQIILFILKTIGILLLSILGILLILVLVVLFVPIRYQVVAKKYDDIQFNVKIKWLLRVIYAKLCYEKEKINYQLRIFGFHILDSEKPKKMKHKKTFMKHNKKRNIKKRNNNKRNNNKRNGTKNESNIRGTNNGTSKKEYEKNSVSKLDQIKSYKDVERLGIPKDETDKKYSSANKIQNNSVKEATKEIKSLGENYGEGYQKIPLIEDKKYSFWEMICNKIRLFFQKTKDFFVKIKNLMSQIKNKLLNLKLTKDNIISRITLIRSFLTIETNKKGLKKIWLSIKKIAKHIFPKKIKGNIRFGTGDPCSTGQVLGVISLTYHLYGKSVKITPDFTDEIYEGELYVKGRIRLFTLLIICIKLLLDKNFKLLIKSYQELKEEL